MRKKFFEKKFSTTQLICGILIGSLLLNPLPVYSAVEDNICELSSVLAPFFGVGSETEVPTADEFLSASLVEKINYLEAENVDLRNQLLSLEAGHNTLAGKADYLQITSDSIITSVGGIQTSLNSLVIPDYSSNFTVLSAGISGINTTLATKADKNDVTALTTQITSLATKIDSVSDAVQESTAAANSLYNLYVYIPKSVIPYNCAGYEVSITSPSGLQTVESKLKDTGDYWSTKLYFDFMGNECKLKYTVPLDNTRNLSLESKVAISEPGQEHLLVGGDTYFNRLCTWEQVRSVVQAGKSNNWFSVGDTRTIDLSSMGAGNATVTLVDIAPDGKRITCMITSYSAGVPSHAMNSSGYNTGSWRSSELRTWLNGDGYYDKLPSDLKAVIADSTVVTGDYANGVEAGGANITTTDKLFLPAENEVFGQRTCSTKNEVSATKQFQYFATIATSQSSRACCGVWWLRSPSYYNGSGFCCVSGGSYYYDSASRSYSVFPALCIE